MFYSTKILGVDQVDWTRHLFGAAATGVVREAERAIREGAGPDAREEKDGFTPMFVASIKDHPTIIKLLVKYGANLNALSSDGNKTPLLAACYAGNIKAVQELVIQGADYNLPNKRGDTPLMVATYKNHLDIVKFFLSIGTFWDVGKKTSIGNLLIDQQTYANGYTALHMACISQNSDIAIYLIKSGADITFVDYIGKNALMMVVINGDMKIMNYLFQENQGRIDIDLADNLGNTALIYAVGYGRIEAVKILIEHNCSLTASNSMNETALTIAQKGNLPEILRILQLHYEISTVETDLNGLNNLNDDNTIHENISIKDGF
eukprot:gene10710-14381_t